MTTPNTKANLLSTIQDVVHNISATANAIDRLANSTPVRALVWKRAITTVGPRVAWVVLPLVGVGVGYLGVRAWQRRGQDASPALGQTQSSRETLTS